MIFLSKRPFASKTLENAIYRTPNCKQNAYCFRNILSTAHIYTCLSIFNRIIGKRFKSIVCSHFDIVIIYVRAHSYAIPPPCHPNTLEACTSVSSAVWPTCWCWTILLLVDGLLSPIGIARWTGFQNLAWTLPAWNISTLVLLVSWFMLPFQMCCGRGGDVE